MPEDNQPNSGQAKGISLSWYVGFVLVIALVVSGWFAYWRNATVWVPGTSPAEQGQFGDMFGALNALFSALAFAVIFFTLCFQVKQLRDQQAELNETVRLQKESAEALRKQAEANELSAKLAASDSLVQAISRQIEHCKEDSPELSFLRRELNEAIGDLRSLIRSQNVFPGLPNSTANDVPLTQADIIELFSKHIRYLTPEDVKSRMPSVSSQLIRYGVNSRKRLENVLNAKQLIDLIERLYLEELFRPPHKPLDPDAVATWVVMMFVNPTPSKLDEIRIAVRNSPERRDKDKIPIPPFVYNGKNIHSSQRAIVIYPTKEHQSCAHFIHAIDLAKDWVKNHPQSEKPKIHYLDLDKRTWEVANW